MNSSKKIIKRVENDLKPHNAETIKNILEIYKTSNKCCAIQATGTGKTFLILRLLEIYNDEEKSAVIFAPNRDIIKQTKKRMKKFGLNNAIFYTYQKLARMTDEEIADIKVDLIVCDELHRTGAKTWGQKFEALVETHPDSKVFGVTATPLRCTDGRDMAEEYFDGNKACNISLAEALVREIIPVMPLYVSALYTFEEEYQNMSEKIEKGNNSVEEKAELQKELLAAKQQLEKANGVPEIIKKYITNFNGKYLVFCKDKKHLYAMKDVVVGWFRESGYDGKIFEYPYYSDSSVVRKNLENFENNNEDGLKLLFIIDKLNEGLHLDEVHGCILLRTTVSNIIYYQQIGRAIDAGSNEQRVILDLVSNFSSLKSFNLKKELKEKVKERQNGNFSDCSEEFELDKFDVVDCVQECVDVFKSVDDKIVRKIIPFSDNDIEMIIKYYPSIGYNVNEMLEQKRTRKSLELKAAELGVTKKRDVKSEFWTEEEDSILIEKYGSLGTNCINYLNKTKKQISYRASKLGLKFDKRNNWTKKDDEILLNNYPKLGAKGCLQLLNGKSHPSILSRANKLNIKFIKEDLWSDNDEKILLKEYSNMNLKQLSQLLNRTEKSIETRMVLLGINFNKRRPWTEQEDDYLRRNYKFNEKTVKDIANHLNRTEGSVKSRVSRLGIGTTKDSIRKSRFKFVKWDKRKNIWYVVFNVDGQRKYFGCFKDEDEAGRVALEKAKEYGKPI